jgi:calcium-dependent protein kinase
MYLAMQISEKEVNDLRKIFLKLDKDGNGMISREEMMIGLDYLKKEVNCKLTNQDIDQIFNAMDFDNSGQVDYTEFIASCLDGTIKKNEKFLRKEFEKLDSDKDGKLNKEDIEQIVHSDTNVNKIDVQRMIDEADLDGDGKIDYSEFLVLLRERTRTNFFIVA